MWVNLGAKELRFSSMKEVTIMSDFLAFLAMFFGCMEIFLTIKSFFQIRREPKNKFPRIARLLLLFGSTFGMVLIFLSFDLIFKWI